MHAAYLHISIFDSFVVVLRFSLSSDSISTECVTLLAREHTVPPKDVTIMDAEGQRLDGLIGPYDEGADLILICEADGGKRTLSFGVFAPVVLRDVTQCYAPGTRINA